MSVMVERAKWLAKMVHADEIRKDGKPYYTHCDNVAEAVKDKGEIFESVGHMHDVLENAKNPDTIRLLMTDYFPQEVIHLVETLTHDKNIYYNHYIDVVCNNPKALIIKFEDMINNTNDVDQPNYSERQFKKYREACIYMIAKGKDVPKILKERLKIEPELVLGE